MEKPKASLDEVSQKFDLNEIVGQDISGDEKLVMAIGQKIIDYMEERVEDGMGYGRTKLKPPYSDAYENSLAFKAAGKSKNDVNMKLSGDMMASIDILDVNGSKITIGIDDPDQVPKAFNHQTGDTVPRRPFFGLTKAELKEYVINEFKDEIKAKRTTSSEEQSRLISAIRGIRTLAEFLGD
jgi:hypothetical protein